MPESKVKFEKKPDAKKRFSELKRIELIRKSQEEIRLEAVTQTDVNVVGRRIPFLCSSIAETGIGLIFHVGSNAVYIRTLAKWIGVTETYDIAFNIDAGLTLIFCVKNPIHAVCCFGIQIADTEHDRAAAERSITGETNSVPLELE